MKIKSHVMGNALMHGDCWAVSICTEFRFASGTVGKGFVSNGWKFSKKPQKCFKKKSIACKRSSGKKNPILLRKIV